MCLIAFIHALRIVHFVISVLRIKPFQQICKLLPLQSNSRGPGVILLRYAYSLQPFGTMAMTSWFGHGRSMQTAITCCCLMAFVLFGYDQGVFGGILQNKNWLDQFGHPSDTKTGIIVSSYNLGCLLGCFSEYSRFVYMRCCRSGPNCASSLFSSYLYSFGQFER